MRVLIACEFSGTVREAFRARGHDAWSVDLLPSERPGPRLIENISESRRLCFTPGSHRRWDLIIAHPPCRYLCNSGIRWLYNGGKLSGGRDEERWRLMGEAAEFFRMCLDAPCPRMAVENSRPHKYAEPIMGEPSQVIHPWQFGVPETKETWLWLKGLPPLNPTSIVPKHLRRNSVHRASPGPERWMERSRTFQGIADAMAEQWGSSPCP